MRPIVLILMLVLLAGCEPSQQPWSYAPCYMRNYENESVVRVVEAIDCPPMSMHYQMVRVDEHHWALFTSPFGDRKAPRVYPYKEPS
jgi:hypothetical protein